MGIVTEHMWNRNSQLKVKINALNCQKSNSKNFYVKWPLSPSVPFPLLRWLRFLIKQHPHLKKKTDWANMGKKILDMSFLHQELSVRIRLELNELL